MAMNVLAPVPYADCECRCCGARGRHTSYITMFVEKPLLTGSGPDMYLHLPVRVPYCDRCFAARRRSLRRLNILFWPLFVALCAAILLTEPRFILLGLLTIAVYILLRVCLRRKYKAGRSSGRNLPVIRHLKEHGWKKGVSEADFSRLSPYMPEDLVRDLDAVADRYGYIVIDDADNSPVDYRTYAGQLYESLTEQADFSD